MPSDALQGLNDRQRDAVRTIDGPLLIVAGPGSGKTRVITHRIAYVVQQAGVRPYRIAALTFTNKAAREMQARLFGASGEDAAAPLLGERERNSGLAVGTFHSFCARLLRRDGDVMGLDSNFAIYDSADQNAAIKRAMSEAGVDTKTFSPGVALSRISAAKSELVGVEGFALRKKDYLDEVAHRVYEQYERILAQSSALDFDDLLLKTFLLLRDFPQVAEKYQDRYVHLMIDEFQDTNVAQYAIARKIAEGYNNLVVVGDPDQSIYSWRNADIRNILSFQRDYPTAKVITLDQSYRSTRTILDAAQEVISANSQRVDKSLWTNNTLGAPIVVREEYNAEDEAQYVIREVQRLNRNEGFAYGDVAVMYRVNAQSRALGRGVSALRRGLPDSGRAEVLPAPGSERRGRLSAAGVQPPRRHRARSRHQHPHARHRPAHPGPPEPRRASRRNVHVRRHREHGGRRRPLPPSVQRRRCVGSATSSAAWPKRAARSTSSS